MTRALRVDTLTLTALEATLAVYRDPERAMREIPVLRLLAVGATDLERRAKKISLRLTTAGFAAEAIATESQVGGGAFPNASLPSAGVALEGDPASLSAKLRAGAPAIIGRINGGRLLLDLRAVPEQADDELAAAVMAALA
jgi:L-seryl-tRNA(Ser) seleniumtransferase